MWFRNGSSLTSVLKKAFFIAAAATFIALNPAMTVHEYRNDPDFGSVIQYAQEQKMSDFMHSWSELIPCLPDGIGSPMGSQQDLLETFYYVAEYAEKRFTPYKMKKNKDGTSEPLYIENAYPPSIVHVEGHPVAGYREWTMSHRFKMSPAPALT